MTFRDVSRVSLINRSSRYCDALGSVRELAGDQIADAVKPLWGLNEEGEIHTLWRHSGVPGLYFMMGKC